MAIDPKARAGHGWNLVRDPAHRGQPGERRLPMPTGIIVKHDIARTEIGALARERLVDGS